MKRILAIMVPAHAVSMGEVALPNIRLALKSLQ